MKIGTTILRNFVLMFPNGCEVQFLKDTEVDNSSGSNPDCCNG